MYLLQKLNSFPFLLGFIFSSFYVLFPFLYSFFKTPLGFVYVPVNNQHRLAGDNRFYAAGVQEARLNFFKYKHPCAIEIGGMAIDYTRVSSYRTAALLGLFIRDERIAFVLSFVGAVLIQYVLIFSISIYLFDYSYWIALFVAMVTLYYYKAFSFVKSRNALKDVYKYIKTHIVNSDNEMFFDKVNDNFRYVIMSIAGIYTWLTMLIIIYSFSNPNLYIFSGLLGLYYIAIPFVYPSTSLFSLFTLIVSVFIDGIVKNSYEIIVTTAAVGLISVIILLLTGVLKRVKDIRTSNLDVLNMSHNQDENYSITLSSVFKILLKDSFFVIPLVLFFVLIIISMDMYFISVILFAFICLKLYGFFFKKTVLIARFLERGGMHFLVFSIIISVFYILSYVGVELLHIEEASFYLAIVLMIFPLIGCYRMAVNLHKSGSYYMSKQEWDVYRYIKKNTPARSSFLAFSFSNMQLLPVYTHANLYVRGAEWLENPNDELKKYLKALFYVKGNVEGVLEEFKNYFSKEFSSSANFKKNESELNGYHLINTLIYYPFVTIINGIRLTDNNNLNWSKEFLEYLKKFAMPDNDSAIDSDVDYILLDRSDFTISESIREVFFKIYDNEKYALYKRV